MYLGIGRFSLFLIVSSLEQFFRKMVHLVDSRDFVWSVGNYLYPDSYANKYWDVRSHSRNVVNISRLRFRVTLRFSPQLKLNAGKAFPICSNRLAWQLLKWIRCFDEAFYYLLFPLTECICMTREGSAVDHFTLPLPRKYLSLAPANMAKSLACANRWWNAPVSSSNMPAPTSARPCFLSRAAQGTRSTRFPRWEGRIHGLGGIGVIKPRRKLSIVVLHIKPSAC